MKSLSVCSVALLLVGCAAVGAANVREAIAQAHAQCDLPNFKAALLQRLNAARASGADCGPAGRFAPASRLSWNVLLAAAADAHSRDLAATGNLSHTSSDGRTLRERVDAVGYKWRTIGENIAAGPPTVQRAMDGWLASPGHCANIMNPAFKEVGAACAVAAPGAPYTNYWAMKLAAPK